MDVQANIDALRQVAISLLKPTRRELEHGLELHRNSVVIESYGLGLHAPVDAAALNAAIAAGATAAEIDTERVNMGLTRWVEEPGLRQEYRLAREAAGVTCTFQNAGEEGNDPLRLMRRLACHTYLTDAMPEFLHRIFSPEDIVAAHQSGQYASCLATNGVPLPGQLNSVFDELEYIPVFGRLGVRMMHLTYNRRNLIGDGCAEPVDAGLSDFGRAVVAEMNRTGIIIDLAHTGLQTCLDTAKISTRPVVVSHSAVRELNPHIRCKNEAVIRAVVDGGGTMGITNVPAFLGGSGDIRSLLDHIDHLAQKFGTDTITIGSDNGYASIHAASARAQMDNIPARRTRWENFWPANDPVHAPEWQQPVQRDSMAWTNWPMFTVGLVQRGYSDDAIQAIIGGNILRVARAVWKDSLLDSNAVSKAG